MGWGTRQGAECSWSPCFWAGLHGASHLGMRSLPLCGDVQNGLLMAEGMVLGRLFLWPGSACPMAAARLVAFPFLTLSPRQWDGPGEAAFLPALEQPSLDAHTPKTQTLCLIVIRQRAVSSPASFTVTHLISFRLSISWSPLV